VPLVVDASVGLKWVLAERDSWMAHALALSGEELLAPDFWLNEACNVLWVQVAKGVMTREAALDGLALLQSLIVPTRTDDLGLHGLALEIGTAVGHSPYDTLYVAFALAVGAEAVVLSDRRFAEAMRAHADPRLAGMVLPLEEWAKLRGLNGSN
jgi:predicted nucleic acid-binding protein